MRNTLRFVPRYAVLAMVPLVVSDNFLLNQLSTEEVQRVPKRGAGMLLVQLGPEEREERVAAMEAPRLRDREVREETQALRLREDPRGPSSIGRPQVDSTEEAELDHARSPDVVGGHHVCSS